MEKSQACVALYLSPVYLGMINAAKNPQSIDIDMSFPLTSIKQEIDPVQGPGQGFCL